MSPSSFAQVCRRMLSQGQRFGMAERRRQFRPRVELLEDRTLLAVHLLRSFQDIKFNQTLCGCTPPDTQMAVGPTRVVGAVNTAITLKNKFGGTIVAPTEFQTFMASVFVAGQDFSDPQTVYDDQANRFYVGIIEFDPSGLNGQFDLAVSKTSSPASLTGADWTFFAFTSVNEGNTEFPDFPKMGWNLDGVFVSFNQFSAGFDHDLILMIDKPSLLAGVSVSNTTNVFTGSDHNILIPARMHKETTFLEYLVGAIGGGAPGTTNVRVVKLTGYPFAPVLANFFPLVNAYDDSPGVPGLTFQIDNRMLSVDWVDNGSIQRLVASQNIGDPASGLNLARWYEFNAPTGAGIPGLVQQGDINLGGSVSTSYPSVAINLYDSIAMTFLENDPAHSTSMFVDMRVRTDPAGSMETPLLVKAGVPPVAFELRGGDYSATEFDPVDPSLFWAANEFQADNSGDNFHWNTQIAEFNFVGQGQWATVLPMPTARGWLGGVLASDGEIYAIGGSDPFSTRLDTVERLATSGGNAGVWMTRHSLTLARQGLAAAAGSNGSVYAYGGIQQSGVLNSVERYDPFTDRWTPAAPLPHARGYLAGAGDPSLSPTTIFAVGGQTTNAPASASSEVDAFDEGSASWTVLTPLPFGVSGAAAVVGGSNGKLYVFGGRRTTGLVTGLSEVYNPLTHTWTPVAPMPTPRWGAQATVGPSGKILVVGGFDGAGDALDTVESFNTVTASWDGEYTPMTTPRGGLGVVAGFDAKVYAFGGFPRAPITNNLIVNGGFEAAGGSLNNWTTAVQAGSNSSGKWYVQSGTSSPTSGFPVPAPPGPTHAAMYDQRGPTSAVMYQDFAVPASVTTAFLQFDRFIGNRFDRFITPASLDFTFPGGNQQARVDIMTTAAPVFSVAAGDVLLNVFQTNVGDPNISGYTTNTTDVTALLQANLGGTLRLRFAGVDRNFFLQFGVDNVELDVNGTRALATTEALRNTIGGPSGNEQDGKLPTLAVSDPTLTIAPSLTGFNGLTTVVTGSSSGLFPNASTVTSVLGGDVAVFTGLMAAEASTPALPDPTAGVVPVAVTPLLWDVPVTVASNDTTPRDRADAVFAAGADTLSADNADALFAGIS